jgi:UDP-2,3-diacylglucosamine pyrophosphatase LpxH
MHVFVSDLHMDDTETSGSVSDTDLTAFAARLERLATEKEKKITLVFVGDVLELLRSSKWEALWTNFNKTAPWSGMGRGFVNFRNGHAESCAVEIAEAIRARYVGFSAKLKELVHSETIKTEYIFGNHDYMVQLSQILREIVVDILALSHDPKQPFQPTYWDEHSSVFATHGHAADPVNWHREVDGYWALGDAIVLRIVNRFATAACKELSLSVAVETGQLLQQIDNIEPIADIPVYIRWLAERSLAIRDQRETIEKVWKQVVEEFLEIKEFKDRDGYGAGPYQAVRRIFELSTHIGLATLVADRQKLFSSAGTAYLHAASREANKQHQKFRFILFGHTHEPMLVPLGETGGRTSFYVNTGCWRTMVSRTSVKAPGPFVRRRVASYFVVDEDDGGTARERYHLHQEWHAS